MLRILDKIKLLNFVWVQVTIGLNNRHWYCSVYFGAWTCRCFGDRCFGDLVCRHRFGKKLSKCLQQLRHPELLSFPSIAGKLETKRPFSFLRGVPVVAKNRVERIGAIADNLIHSDVDIVGLQEIWFRDDYALICNLVEHVFPYFYYFRRYGRLVCSWGNIR